MQNADLIEKRWTLYWIKNLFSYVKMGQKVLTSGDIKIEKKKITAIRFLFI